MSKRYAPSEGDMRDLRLAIERDQRGDSSALRETLENLLTRAYRQGTQDLDDPYLRMVRASRFPA